MLAQNVASLYQATLDKPRDFVYNNRVSDCA